MSSFFLLSAYCLVGEGGAVKVQYSINKTYHVNLPVASAVLSCKGGGPYNFYQFLYLQQHSLPCQPSSYYQRKILFLQKHNLPSPTSRLPWYCFYMFLHVFICAYMFLLPQVIGFFLLQVTPDRRLWELEVIIIRVRLWNPVLCLCSIA